LSWKPGKGWRIVRSEFKIGGAAVSGDDARQLSGFYDRPEDAWMDALGRAVDEQAHAV
jgi:hypothetical protein